MIIIETPRLVLREFSMDDAPSLFELNSDHEVLKYTGDKPFATINDAIQFVLNYDQYIKYGIGRWAVVLKEDNSFIGWCGLKFVEELNEINLGYRILKKHWNKGYVTEAARASLEYGFKTLNLKCIVGRAMKENKASIRVFEKIGMQYWKDYEFIEHPGVYYRLMSDTENSVG